MQNRKNYHSPSTALWEANKLFQLIQSLHLPKGRLGDLIRLRFIEDCLIVDPEWLRSKNRNAWRKAFQLKPLSPSQSFPTDPQHRMVNP